MTLEQFRAATDAIEAAVKTTDYEISLITDFGRFHGRWSRIGSLVVVTDGKGARTFVPYDAVLAVATYNPTLERRPWSHNAAPVVAFKP